MSITRRTTLARIAGTALAAVFASAKATAGLFHRARRCAETQPSRFVMMQTPCAHKYAIGSTSFESTFAYSLNTPATITITGVPATQQTPATSFDNNNVTV